MEDRVENNYNIGYLEKIADKVLPISVFSGSFISLILSFYFYPFFGNNEQLRLIVSGGINGLVTIVLMSYFINVFRTSDSKKPILVSFIIPCVWMMASVLAIIIYNLSVGMLFQLVQFGIFGMQMYFTAIIVVIKNKFMKFISYFDYYALVLIPFSIFYIIRYFVAEWSEQNPLNCFAGMTYMTIAFIFLPVIAVMISQCFLLEHSTRKNAFHILCSILFWCVIVFSGTRSAIVCIFFFLVCMFFFNFILKLKKLRALVILTAIFIGIFILCTYIILPEGTGHAVRSENFNYDMDIYHNESRKNLEVYDAEHNTETINVQEFYVNYLVNSGKNKDESIAELHKNLKDGKPILDFKSDKDEQTFKSYELYFGRNILFDLSIQECKSAILFGHGTNYYQNKYDNYPHNSFLEVLCDYGLVGLIIFTSIIILILIKVFPIAIQNRFVCILLLLCLMWIPISCLSGTVYLNYNLIFSISFGLICILFKERLLNK